MSSTVFRVRSLRDSVGLVLTKPGDTFLVVHVSTSGPRDLGRGLRSDWPLCVPGGRGPRPSGGDRCTLVAEWTDQGEVRPLPEHHETPLAHVQGPHEAQVLHLVRPVQTPLPRTSRAGPWCRTSATATEVRPRSIRPHTGWGPSSVLTTVGSAVESLVRQGGVLVSSGHSAVLTQKFWSNLLLLRLYTCHPRRGVVYYPPKKRGAKLRLKDTKRSKEITGA